MTIQKIEYDEKDYEVIQTQQMDDELLLKLVQFNTGYYGVITENLQENDEIVTLISPEKGETTKENNNITILTGGLGCVSYMLFAKNSKNYMENNPIELVIRLGQDAGEEYRELITRDQAHTLYEKAEICYELMEMKFKNSFHYRYGDLILTALTCGSIILFFFAFINTLKLYGVI